MWGFFHQGATSSWGTFACLGPLAVSFAAVTLAVSNVVHRGATIQAAAPGVAGSYFAPSDDEYL